MAYKITFSLLLLLMILLACTTQIDDTSLAVHDESMQRAMGAFVLAKGLNAVISLIQGTELSFTPVGIGLTFSIGEVLDPLNDLIERFSWVMLFASVSLGVQKIMLTFSSMDIVVGGMVAVSLALLIITWKKEFQNPFTVTLLLRFMAVLLLFRFATIGFVYLQTLSFEHLMANDYQQATLQLKETEETLQAIENEQLQIQKPQPKQAESDSWLPDIVGGTSEMLDDASNMMHKLDISSQISQLQEAVDSAQQHVINLITIFVVQTVLLPLLYLWMLLTALKWAFRTEFDPKTIYATLHKKRI